MRPFQRTKRPPHFSSNRNQWYCCNIRCRLCNNPDLSGLCSWLCFYG